MSGQSQLVASGQMLLAAHTQSTGLDNSSDGWPVDQSGVGGVSLEPVCTDRVLENAVGDRQVALDRAR